MIAALYISGGIFIVAFLIFLLGMFFAWLTSGERVDWPYALVGFGVAGIIVAIIVFVFTLAYKLISTGIANL